MRTLRTILHVVVLTLCGASLAPSVDARIDPADTRLLTQPAIGASHLAFIYSGDLYVADLNGGGNP